MSVQEIAPGVAHLRTVIANMYLIGTPGSSWFLVDTGGPKHARVIVKAAEKRFGADSRPEFILLTHGHFDHCGSAWQLAEHWHVPIYAHRLEHPYLTGISPYPPKDPTIGGAMAFLSRFFPTKAVNLRPHLRELPLDGEVPGHPEWRWFFAPGHAPGQVSLFHSGMRVLLAGDAFTTMNVDSWIALATEKPEISRPPAPFTPDWVAARETIVALSKLEPIVVACGHGKPMSGESVAANLRHLGRNFPMPKHGRYIPEPAQTDELGIRYVPPAMPDPLPKIAMTIAGAAMLAGGLIFLHLRQGRDERALRGSV